MKIIRHNWNDLIGLLCIDFTNYWPALMNHSGTRCSWGSSIPKRYKTCSIIETFSILPLSPTFRCWFGPLAVAVFLFGNFFQVVRRSCFCWLATLGDIKINRNDQQFLADASKQEPEQWNRWHGTKCFRRWLSFTFSYNRVSLPVIVATSYCFPSVLPSLSRLVNVQSVMAWSRQQIFECSVLCLAIKVYQSSAAK